MQVDPEYLQEIIDCLDQPSMSGQSEQQPKMSHIRIVAQRERNVRFNTTGTGFIFEVDDTNLSVSDFYGIFDELVQSILKDFDSDDMVGLQLSLEGLDSVIYHPFTRADQITVQRLLDIGLLEKVVQSNAKVSLKNIEVKVVRVMLPKGGKRLYKFSHSSLHEFLRRKKCVISASGAGDLCFGRCLALGINIHTSNQKDFTNLYHSQGRLTSEAKTLYLTAGVFFGSIGIKELTKFKVSQPQYQIIIYENDYVILIQCTFLILFLQYHSAFTIC